jgi:hypothetical protein
MWCQRHGCQTLVSSTGACGVRDVVPATLVPRDMGVSRRCLAPAHVVSGVSARDLSLVPVPEMWVSSTSACGVETWVSVVGVWHQRMWCQSRRCLALTHVVSVVGVRDMGVRRGSLALAHVVSETWVSDTGVWHQRMWCQTPVSGTGAYGARDVSVNTL